MATSTREARRRRIVERGEDRLALITGRIQTLDSSPSSPSPSSSSSSLSSSASLSLSSQQPHHSHTFSSPPSLLRQDQISRDPRVHPTSIVAPDAINENEEENIRSTPLTRDVTGNGSSENPTIDSDNKVEPQLRKHKTNVEDIRSPPLEVSNVSSSEVENTRNLTSHDSRPLPRRESQLHHPKIFTPKHISSSITASENFRVLCSILIALLVVLSHISFPILNAETVKSFITSKPLYLVLLSSFTIVVAHLLFGKQGGSRRAGVEARRVPSSEDLKAENAMNIGNALDTGLLIYKAFSAAFMDCSIYAVVVVCGLSLLQYTGLSSSS